MRVPERFVLRDEDQSPVRPAVTESENNRVAPCAAHQHRAGLEKLDRCISG